MTRLLSSLLGTAALALPLMAGEAFAQTEITDNRDATVRTSVTGDLTITDTSTISPTTGAGVVVDSSNDVDIDGTIQIEDRDDATGVEIQTGNSGDVTLGGDILITEDYTPEDTDDDRIADGPVAIGSGRTGILISGADTFTGNLVTEAASRIVVEGNDSYGIRLASSATFAGNMDLDGSIGMTGDRSVAVALEGDVDGDVTVGGNVAAVGEDARAVLVSGDVSGGLSISSAISNTGYRFASRQAARIRDLLGDEDRLQAGSAVQINGNIAGGVFFREVVETTTNDDGTETSVVVARASLNHAGSAPAIIIDGDGTPLSIGVVAEITDASDPNFDADLQYAFINQGDLVASGVFDDFDATLFQARDVTLSGGISNTGSLSATTFRGGDDGTDDADGQTGLARVVVFGDNAIAERIDNSGIIIASVVEAADVVFADRENIIAARDVRAVAIDIGAMAELAEINNSGQITALATGRQGEAVVVRDASGTLSTITNTGLIQAIGVNSDTAGLEEADISLIALDLSANTLGVTLTQSQSGSTLPSITGDILLGSGDDVVTSTAGSIVGDISLGEGTDTLTLADTTYLGRIDDPDGTLALRVTGGTLGLSGSQPLRVTEATLDGDVAFIPSIDGQAGTASTIVSSGDLTVGEDVTIRPVLESLVGGTGNPTRFALLQAANLVFAPDVSTLGEGFSPFLYDTTYSVDPDTGTLFVDFRVRSTEELGLSELQGSAFDATFEALGANPALARAIINIDNGESFDAAYNQLLPEFAAAARQFVLANTDGAVGAVGSHLDAARRGQAQPGGFWIQEFFYYADRERAQLAEQYRGQGFGFTGGLDTALGPFHAVGLNIGFASTEIEDTVGTDEPLDLITYQLGAYAGFESGGLGIDAYAGYGFNDFDSNRRVRIGDFAADSSGEWSGQHYNASLRAGYDLPIGGRFWARPTVSLDYLSLTEDAYTEDGPLGVAFDIDERTVDTGAVTAMLNLGAEFSGKRTWVRPALRVGYRNEFVGDVITTGTFAGLSTPFAIEAAEFPDQGLLLGLSILAGSDFSSFGFDLDTDIRDGFIRTTGRVVVRVLF